MLPLFQVTPHNAQDKQAEEQRLFGDKRGFIFEGQKEGVFLFLFG
jgi:hypothetical protein